MVTLRLAARQSQPRNLVEDTVQKELVEDTVQKELIREEKEEEDNYAFVLDK